MEHKWGVGCGVAASGVRDMYNTIISYLAHASRLCVITCLAKQSFSLKRVNITWFVMALLLIMSGVACQNTVKNTRGSGRGETAAEETVILSELSIRSPF